jgi:hypothetical protein
MSGTLVTEIKQCVQLKKNKSWHPIMPKPRERCLKEMARNRKILLWFYFSTYVILWKKGRRVSSLLLREQIKKN